MADESAIVWRDGIQGHCMRRPSFQFYPADWLGNTNLRRCTHAEKGIWLDVMCLMHDSPSDYGILRWPLAEIAQAIGCQIQALESLISKGVMKGADIGGMCEPFIYVARSGRQDRPPVTLIPAQPGPIWYSSRMVRDEYKSKHRGGDTRFGSPNRPVGDGKGVHPNHHPNHHPDFTQKVPATLIDQAQLPETAILGPESPKTSPTQRNGDEFGERVGDGSSSSASASPKREREAPQDKPAPTPKVKREKSPELTFADWSDRVRAEGKKLITDAPVWEYAESINLPREFVEIAWYQFKNRYLTDPGYTKKKYADWRRAFRNSVEGNWFGIWYRNKAGEFQLTTVGEQASRALDAYEAAMGSQGVVT